MIGGAGFVGIGWMSSLDVPVGNIAIVVDSGSGTVVQVGDGSTPVFQFAALLHPLISARQISMV